MDIVGRKFNENEANKVMIQLFKKHGTLKKFKKNDIIFNEGDQTDAFYLVESGLLKISQSTLEGQNITFFLRKKGDIFGVLEIILEQRRKRYAQCLNNCQLRMLTQKKFMELAGNHLNLVNHFLVIVSQRLLLTQQNLGMLISKPVPWRLAWLLKQLSESGEKKSFTVFHELTHEEISNIIGCTRQTVSETLNKWDKEGLINYSKEKVVIHNIDPLLN